MLRGELKAISASAKTAELRASDRATKLHLEDLQSEIARILDPKYQQANPPQQGQPIQIPTSEDGEFCWTDYAVSK